MKKGKSYGIADSEWDNPKNVPVLTKKPGVGHREYPSKVKPAQAAHEVPGSSPFFKKFGKAKAKKQKIAAILNKARKGG